MERDQTNSSEPKKIDQENVKVIEWEEFEQELARLWSLSSALSEAKERKQSLQQKLESLIQVGFLVDAQTFSLLLILMKIFFPFLLADEMLFWKRNRYGFFFFCSFYW